MGKKKKDPFICLVESNLIIPYQAYRRIIYYCWSAPGEVSGFAKTREKDGDYIVKDVKIFHQRCNPVHTELDSEDLSKFLVGLIRKNENIQDWNLWWHTHKTFDTYFSGEDLETIRVLSSRSKIISMCVNDKCNLTAQVDEKGETEKLKVCIIPDKGTSIQRNCYKETKRKVKEDNRVFRIKRSNVHKAIDFIEYENDALLNCNSDRGRSSREFCDAHTIEDGYRSYYGI